MDGRKSIEKYDFRLTEPPNAREWYDAESVKLVLGGTLSNLPEEPICPKIGILSLEKNYKLRKIPPDFFTNMPLLTFLDLSETAIKAFPKSMFELPVLATLLLKNCKFLMKLPSEVGKLRRLEILDMEGTEIINLPIEIKELSLLIILRVSLYGCLDHDGKNSSQSNEIIPFGVISALSQLEEVSIDVNPEDERWDACVERILNEVCGLTKLRSLKFYFPRVELLSRIKLDQPKFKLIVGGHSKRIISRLPTNVELQLESRSRCLKYINGEGVPEEVIKMILQNATTFHLDRHMTARKLTEFGIENMDSLEYCVLGECNEMQVIIDGNDVHSCQIVRESSGARWIGFNSLKFLYIYYMKNLKSIWEGPTHKRCLNGLKSLTLATCPKLTTIFTVGLLESLCNLEELTVRDCPAIKSLVSCEEGAKQSTSYLPELRSISLHYVPNLLSISSEVRIAPKLESLSLYNCPKLESLSIKEVSGEHLTKITGETDWWEALELTQVQRDKFEDIFVSTNADTSENGPTDHFKNTKEILLAVKELQMKVGIKDGGVVCNNQSESAVKPKEEEMSGIEALVGGALLGAVAGELLKAIMRTKEQASNFRPMFNRLEATLNSIIPRLDEISRLNHELDFQHDEIEELKAIINDGTTLVLKCSKLSSINILQKLRYSKELSNLDDKIRNYFITLLPLDNFRMDLEMLMLVRQLHTKLVGESAGLLAEKGILAIQECQEAKMYQRKTGKKLFLLRGCPYYDLDLQDLQSYEPVCKGTYTTSYKCKTKYGDILVKSINLEVKVRESEFEQRMEAIGRVGQHPNVMLPFGYFSSEITRFLLYDYAPASTLSALLKEPMEFGTRSNWDTKLKIVLGIAKGISHIHSEGGIVHGNIKSSNVLLTQDLNGCISDFGLAPIMMSFPATTSQTRRRLTPELPAPELFKNKEATRNSDVYNFGVMLYEIVSMYNMNLLWHLGVLNEQVKIMQIVWKCTKKNPDRRPKMEEVVRLIQNTISQEEPAHPFRTHSSESEFETA